MKALTVTQVVLWEDGTYTTFTTAVDTDSVPFNSSGGAGHKNEDEIWQELVDIRRQTDRYRERH